MTEERYDLRESKRSVRELYPVLRDAHGNVIDGFHRLEIDPTWHDEILPWIKTPTQLALARIIANTHRRTVSREERAAQIRELAKSLMDHDGVAKEEIVSTIAELTTFSEIYVRSLLPDEYKIRPGVGGRPVNLRFIPDETSVTQITVPTGTPEPPTGNTTPDTREKLPDEGAPATLAKKTPEEYVANYFSRYLRPDEDFLAWELCRMYRISEEKAKDLIEKFKARRQAKRKTRRAFAEPKTPTTRCPLCLRDGADRNLILARVEDPDVAQTTLAEFIAEAMRR